MRLRRPARAGTDAAENASGLAFQRAPDYEPPDWPGPHRPQQMHLDVMVEDLEVADAAVRAIGARRLSAVLSATLGDSNIRTIRSQPCPRGLSAGSTPSGGSASSPSGTRPRTCSCMRPRS
ncbi:MAG: hypothetical protein HHJ10_13235 [Cellulomonas sp.]|uniref:VOC family protein n=1 Tax=Cellulomonas sp. TaxID=40001 RepID=UPI0017BFAF86|nr:VOC family protein [Cellulomonas sp.]NMM31964.1 hypothetical protein [Cellulomonas sp.]